MSKVKEHFKKHKTSYIVGGVTAIVCTSTGLILGSKTPLVSSKNQNVGLVIWKPKQTIEVVVEALGDPGNIIQDTTTGTIYASQSQAARALGVNSARFSELFAGKIDHIKGHTFEKLGKAHVA